MNSNRTWWTIVAVVIFGGLLYLLTPILIPFLLAAILAYLTDPIVGRLVQLKLPRTAAVIIVFVFLFSCIILFFLFLIPLLEEQIVLFIKSIPQVILWGQEKVLPWLDRYFHISDLLGGQTLQSLLSAHWHQAGSVVTPLWHIVTSSTSTIFIFLLNLILIPVVTFYLLRDWDTMLEEIRHMLPRSHEPLIMRLMQECHLVLSAFFRGQLLVMVALAIYYTVALWIVGLQFALLIGVMVGLISIVPYLGFIVGLLVAVITSLVQFQDGIHVVYVLIVFMIGQVLESMILTPWLIGDRIGLHPVVVIFSVLAGGQLFGFLGVLLALPVAAVIMVLLRHLHKVYLSSKLYKTKTP